MAPLFAGWLHFPDRKGLVSGIIMSGFGMGVFIYSIVSNRIANPYNLSLTLPDKKLSTKVVYYYFAESVFNNVLLYLMILCSSLTCGQF